MPKPATAQEKVLRMMAEGWDLECPRFARETFQLRKGRESKTIHPATVHALWGPYIVRKPDWKFTLTDLGRAAIEEMGVKE